jgi:hypothetical protein
MRTCAKCGAAENPIGRLRFKKHSDGGIYCENCLQSVSILGAPESPVSHVETLPTPSSAGLIVIPCPTCRGLHPGNHGKTCQTCVGYGSVRIPASNLPVYRPPTEPAPEILTEG